MPFYRFFFGWEGFPTKIDVKKKSWYQIILSFPLEDLETAPSSLLG